MSICELKICKAIGSCISGTFFLYGLGTIGALVVLNRLSREARPLLLLGAKELVGFSHWVSASMDEAKEFWEDLWEEAKHLYRQEVERKISILQKQQELLQKIREQLG
ncbi:MAG: hypothetical protein N2327_04400 [Caldimicrobium sp.]|nr:hypothetical protein [Caldimicrobium sp.]MCX7873654.1 hypothetical protein [Caldimicrobium sp.]MDW8094345.1 hypothetical protein [Caldimicrobium sp.]